MKDIEFILNLNFSNINLDDVKSYLLGSGWLIDVKYKKTGVKILIYETQDDKDWEEQMVSVSSNSFDEGFLYCLKEIQNYYKRVL